MVVMAQQKRRQLLTGLTQTADRRQTGAHEIADRLMSRIRNPDRGQFAGPMQLGQVDCVATVGLDPISRFARDQRRSDDDATVPGKRQLTLNAIERFPYGRNRKGIPESVEIGFTFEAGLEAG